MLAAVRAAAMAEAARPGQVAGFMVVTRCVHTHAAR